VLVEEDVEKRGKKAMSLTIVDNNFLAFSSYIESAFGDSLDCERAEAKGKVFPCAALRRRLALALSQWPRRRCDKAKSKHPKARNDIYTFAVFK
jgi:hypothetical protein